MGFKGDIHGELVRLPEFTVACRLQWDHYNDPDGPDHDVKWSWLPTLLLPKHEELEFHFFANPSPEDTSTKLVHLTASIWCVNREMELPPSSGGLLGDLKQMIQQVGRIHSGLYGAADS